MNTKRKVIVAGNWKMNGSPKEAISFFKDLNFSSAFSSVTHLVFPPFVSLETSQKCAPSSILIGAQNAHFEKKGAFTGEVSGPMLHELNIHWILIGHSERRALFNESEEFLFEKAKSLLEQGFNILFCIGETLEQRERGETQSLLSKQLSNLFSWDSVLKYLPQIHIAYEPVWAIGTGLTATPEQANKTHVWIRSILSKWNFKISEDISILYGGSVNTSNIQTLLECSEIDGVLVGGASLKSESFLEMMKISEFVFENLTKK